MYQFRMYTCDKKILSGKQEFGSYEAAKKAVAKMQAEKLQTFKEPTE